MDFPKIPVPKTLGELMTLALKDLEAVEADPNCKVSMSDWVKRDTEDGHTFCYVCLAGAVMAKTLKGFEYVMDPYAIKTHSRRRLCVDDFGREWDSALKSLDWIRNGFLRPGLGVFYERVSEPLVHCAYLGWSLPQHHQRFMDIPDDDLEFMRPYDGSPRGTRLSSIQERSISYHLNREEWWTVMRKTEALFLKHGL